MTKLNNYRVGLHILEKGGDNQYEYPEYDPYKLRHWTFFNNLEDAQKEYQEYYNKFLNYYKFGFVKDTDYGLNEYDKRYIEWFKWFESKSINLISTNLFPLFDENTGDTLHPPVIEKIN